MIYFVLFFQSMIASGTHIIAKVVVRDIEPITLTMTRSLAAAIIIFLIMKVRKVKLSFERKDYARLALLSFLAVPINQFLFLYGMKYSTPANAALFYGTTPALVLLFSRFTGKDKFSRRKGLGVAVAFIGILLIVFERGIDFSSEYMLGNLLLFIAVIAWGLYTVLGQGMVHKYGAFSTTTMTMILGSIMFLPLGMIGVMKFNLRALTTSDYGGILYLALGTSIIAYFLWYYALGKIEMSKVAIFANLQPVLTTVLAVVLLDQHISSMFIVGGSLALSGVVFTQFG